MSASNGKAPHELRRVLRLGDSVAVMVGIIVGSGIFRTPSTVAEQLQSPVAIYSIWIIGGLTALCGALTYAELASVWPRTGGMYVFLRECFGPLASFLFGWAQLLIIRPSCVAAIADVFANYVGVFVPLPAAGIKLVAVVGILAVSIVNYTGVRVTSVVQNVLTTMKVLALLIIVGAAFSVPAHSGGVPSASVLSFDWSSFQLAGLALIGVYWTYDGWTEITSVAGEVVEPQRTIPRALITGTLVVLGLYLAVNWAFLHILGPSDMAVSKRVATDAMISALGPMGGSIIAVGVIIATLGALTGTMLTGPRVFFAMAIDGIFFSWAKRVHPHYRTPSTAIVLQALVAVPLVLAWEFVELTTYFVFMSLIFYGLGTAAVFRLRRTSQAPQAAYRTLGYPIPPIFFLLVATGILVNTVAGFPMQAFIAVLILLAGVPVYYWWRGIKSRSSVPGNG